MYIYHNFALHLCVYDRFSFPISFAEKVYDKFHASKVVTGLTKLTVLRHPQLHYNITKLWHQNNIFMLEVKFDLGNLLYFAG